MACFKRILILSFIFILFTCSVCHAETIVNPTDKKDGIATQYDNSFLTLYNMQYNTQTEFINYCYANINNANVKKMVSLIYSQFGSLGLNGKFLSITEPINTTSLFIVYFGFLGGCTSSVANTAVSKQVGFANVPCVSGKWYQIAHVYRDTKITFPDSEDNLVNRPLAWCQCIHEGFPQLFKDFGLINNTKDYTNSISNVKSAIDKTNTIMGQVNTNIKNESKKIQDSIKNSTDSINNTITDSNVDDVPISDLPTDDTKDITQNGFNNLFNTIENLFTTGKSVDVVIKIPFTDKSFTINADTVYGDTSKLGAVKSFIQAWYYFFISLFIVKDINKKINKIKSGNIENVQSDDIKADIL